MLALCDEFLNLCDFLGAVKFYSLTIAICMKCYVDIISNIHKANAIRDYYGEVTATKVIFSVWNGLQGWTGLHDLAILQKSLYFGKSMQVTVFDLWSILVI